MTSFEANTPDRPARTSPVKRFGSVSCPELAEGPSDGHARARDLNVSTVDSLFGRHEQCHLTENDHIKVAKTWLLYKVNVVPMDPARLLFIARN